MSAATTSRAPLGTSAPTGTGKLCSTNSTTSNSTTSLEGQGLWNDCKPVQGSVCFDQLQTMSSGGFQLVMNYGQARGSAAQILAYLDQAQAHGMKVIWDFGNAAWFDGTDLRSFWSELAATCNCSDNASFLQYVIGLIKNHSALWGYYFEDDGGNPDTFRSFLATVHQLDPSHPRLYMAASYGTVKDSVNNASAYIDSVDVVGVYHYPVGFTPISRTGEIAKAVQDLASQYGKDFAMGLQSFAWGTDPDGPGRCTPFPECAPFPSKEQMQTMLQLTLQNSHPRIILWYSYFDLSNSGNADAHWTDLVAAKNS